MNLTLFSLQLYVDTKVHPAKKEDVIYSFPLVIYRKGSARSLGNGKLNSEFIRSMAQLGSSLSAETETERCPKPGVGIQSI